MNNQPHQLRRNPLIAITLLIVMALGFTSCSSDDEPDLLVGYYLDIQSEVAFKGSEDDEEQGTMSDSEESNVLYKTIMSMKSALRNAYPMTDHQGDDAAVIAALDSIYHNYKASYGHLEKNTICVVKLYRTRLDGTIIKWSKPLKTYHFGFLPPNLDQM